MGPIDADRAWPYRQQRQLSALPASTHNGFDCKELRPVRNDKGEADSGGGADVEHNELGIEHGGSLCFSIVQGLATVKSEEATVREGCPAGRLFSVTGLKLKSQNTLIA
jgi:hypothetical protein